MNKMIVSKAVGIKLGITNSAVAVMNPTDTEIFIHKDKISQTETTPSCVWKDPKTGGVVIGRKASVHMGTVPSPIRSIKRLMGQQTKVKLTNEEATPEQISAFILKEMKRQIEEDVKEFSTDNMEWIVDRAVITVPAYFDQPQIEATLKAGELAGLEVLELLHEPTSSACYYCWKNNVQNGVFLVYDLGGGTFDVTVLRCTEGAFEVLGISGNRLLGGDDMDRVIAEDLKDRLLKEDYALELDVENDPEDIIRFNKLKFLAEEVKIALSRPNAIEYYLSDTASLKDKEGLPVLIETMYTKSEIEALIRPIIERTIPYCFDALEQASKKADVKLSDVDAVILAGGPTHIPLVRDIVRQHLCSPGSENIVDERARQPRAKCTEPVYEKVDTVVALGAAIRAAASGGLAVFNPEKTVRVSFRGTEVTNAINGRMGGKVEALDPEINIDGGYIKLIIPEMNYEDEDDIKEGGAFAFRQIPLEVAAENRLTFEVYDRLSNLVVSIGRQVEHTTEEITEEIHPIGLLSKAIRLKVLHDGKPYLKELIPALSKIPISKDFTLSRDFTLPYSGDTEIIILPFYQYKKKIKDLKVKVPSSLPKDTPIELNIQVDEHSLITVKGRIGEISFDAMVEPPQHRDMPMDQEIKALDNAFRETLVYLPEGKKKVAKAKYKRARLNLKAAFKSGDKSQAVNDFEEMEELVAELSRTSRPIQPPKELFDELVGECLEINQYVASIAAEVGNPHDPQELTEYIETLRTQGERAYNDRDQKAYSEAAEMLENIRNYLIGLCNKKKPMYELADKARTVGSAKLVEECTNVDEVGSALFGYGAAYHILKDVLDPNISEQKLNQKITLLANSDPGNAILALLLAYINLKDKKLKESVTALRNARPENVFEQRLCTGIADLLEGNTPSELPQSTVDATPEIVQACHILNAASAFCAENFENGYKGILDAMKYTGNNMTKVIEISRILPALCVQSAKDPVPSRLLIEIIREMPSKEADGSSDDIIARCAAAMGENDIACNLWNRNKSRNPDGKSDGDYAEFLCYLAVQAHKSGKPNECIEKLRLAASVGGYLHA